jgi:hypothetical protein
MPIVTNENEIGRDEPNHPNPSYRPQPKYARYDARKHRFGGPTIRAYNPLPDVTLRTTIFVGPGAATESHLLLEIPPGHSISVPRQWAGALKGRGLFGDYDGSGSMPMIILEGDDQ